MRRRWVAGGLAVVSLTAAATAWVIGEDPEVTRPVAVMVGADRGPVTVSVAASGSLRAATTRSLSFTVDGTVDAVAVKAGTKVKAGTVLASLDTTDAATAVSEAQTGLAAAETQLTSAEAAARAATRTKSPTRAPAPTPVTTGPVAVSLGGVPGSAAPGSTGQLAAAAGSRAGRASAVDAVLTAQQRVNRATASLAEAKVALAGATIKAPIDGTVMVVAGVVGAQVRQGATFVTLADTDRMQVTAAFPEADAGALAVGQPATVTLADRVGEQFPATVVQVDPVGTSDGTLVTYGVLLTFTTAPAGLLVGQTASVQVTTGEVADTLRVPSTAVHDAGAGAGTVLVRSGSGTAQRPVEVGLRGDQYTEVTGGLAAGELVARSW